MEIDVEALAGLLGGAQGMSEPTSAGAQTHTCARILSSQLPSLQQAAGDLDWPDEQSRLDSSQRGPPVQQPYPPGDV